MAPDDAGLHDLCWNVHHNRHCPMVVSSGMSTRPSATAARSSRCSKAPTPTSINRTRCAIPAQMRPLVQEKMWRIPAQVSRRRCVESRRRCGVWIGLQPRRFWSSAKQGGLGNDNDDDRGLSPAPPAPQHTPWNTHHTTCSIERTIRHTSIQRDCQCRGVS